MMNDLNVRVRFNEVNNHRVFGRLSPHTRFSRRKECLSLVVE
jgi:hypothetical protein